MDTAGTSAGIGRTWAWDPCGGEALTRALRVRFERAQGAVRIGEALWQRLDHDDVARARGWCEACANMIDDDVAAVDALRDALTELAPSHGAQPPPHDGAWEQRCLDVVLDPATSLFRALHAVLVTKRAAVDDWAALVDVCVMKERHALAEQCLAAHARAEEHVERVRAWLDALEQARTRRVY